MSIPVSPVNAELVRAMQANAQGDTSETRRAVYAALTQSALLVPIARSISGGNPGWQQILGEVAVEFVVRNNPEGQMVMLAFTDEESLKAWKAQDYYYIAPNAVELFQMALEMDAISIMINVAGPQVGGELTRAEFQALASGLLPEVEGQIGTTVITPPPDMPVTFAHLSQPVSDALRNALRVALASYPEIAAGYLWQMQIGEAVPHLVAGVRFGTPLAEDALKAVMNGLGDHIAPHLPAGEFIDFIVVEDESALPVMPVGEARVFWRG